MKKIFLLISLICLLCFTMPVFAAQGGEYTVKEANMTVMIPNDWIVFTPNTTEKDSDVKDYFYDFDAFRQNMIDTNAYLCVFPGNNTYILFTIIENEEFKSIVNLTDFIGAATDNQREELLNLFKQQADQLENNNTSYDINIRDIDYYSSRNYSYFYVDRSIDEVDSQSYSTIINSKQISIAMFTIDGAIPTQLQKDTFQHLIDRISFYDVQPMPDTINIDNVINPHSDIWAKIAVRAIVVLGGTILAAVGLWIKRKLNFLNNPDNETKKDQRERHEREKMMETVSKAWESGSYRQDEMSLNQPSQEEVNEFVEYLDHWKTLGNHAMRDEDVKKGFIMLAYFQNNNLGIAEQIAKKLIAVHGMQEGKWTVVDDALALPINMQASEREKEKFAFGNLDKKYDYWMNMSEKGVSKKDVQLGYFLLNYFKKSVPSRAEAIARKMLEVNRLNHYLMPAEQIELINKARRYNMFSKLSQYAETKILDKNIKSELAGWERLDDSQVIEDELKKGFLLLNYYSDEDELDIAQRIAGRLISICEKPQELFEKAISLYQYPPISEDEKKQLRSKNSYLDMLIKWNAIEDKDLSVDEIKKGYLMLYYFQKEGQLNISMKIARRLIMILSTLMETEQSISPALSPMTEKNEQKTESSLSQTSTSPTNEVKFCRKCGTRLPDGSQFCNKCGTEVK